MFGSMPFRCGKLRRLIFPNHHCGKRTEESADWERYWTAFPEVLACETRSKPDEATTSSDQILDMYYAQDSVVEGGGAGAMIWMAFSSVMCYII